jgi:hypothetical protein
MHDRSGPSRGGDRHFRCFFLCRLWQRELQHSIGQLCLDLVGHDRRGQRKLPIEPVALPFANDRVFVFPGLVNLFVYADHQQVIFDAYLDLLRLESRNGRAN